MNRRRIEPQSGTAFALSAGQTLRVIDPLGEQVADLVAFTAADRTEWLSSGGARLQQHDLPTAGHVLYSNRSTPMLTIVDDTVGRHDFLYTPCSRETFSIIYKTTDPHPSCFDNLVGALGPFGIEPDHIPTTFNLFMNVSVAPDGTLTIDPPRSKPGDSITLRAEIDLWSA